MTDNDYIAEYVKERCPELLDTVDFNLWKLRMASNETIDELCDHLSNLSKAWGRLNKQ
jgi:hypothetical protein